MEKIKSFCKKNIISIILISVMVLEVIICFLDLRYKFHSESIKGGIWYIFFLVIAFVLFALFTILIIKKKEINNKTIPKIFVIFALIFGTFYIGLSPMFTGSDENNHFYRIYEIAEGTFFTPVVKKEIIGSKLPLELKQVAVYSGANWNNKYRNVDEMLKYKIKKQSKTQYDVPGTDTYSNTALYSPVSYLPQVIGVKIGMIFDLPVYLIGILGRVFNLLFYIIIGYFALKIIPKGKLFYLVILLSPNLLQCASTLAADAFVVSLLFLFIAKFMSDYNSKKILSLKDEILYFLLAIIISLCKIVYLPAVFLLLLFKKDNFKLKKIKKYIYCIMVCLISVVLNLLWLKYADRYCAIAYPNSVFQKQFVFSNIIEYGFIFLRTYVTNAMLFIENLFMGRNMFHSKIIIPTIFSYFYVLIVVVALFKDKVKNLFENKAKIFIGILMILMLGLMSSALYIQCTAQSRSIGFPEIVGIQGRYFIPILLLLPLIMPTIKKKITIKEELLLNCVIMCNFVVYLVMMVYFII